ncbi:MAG: OsmC family protein [Bacteroidetes bacterium]|nr:OsmC family protein [Bacteroidota bacterium]
MCSGSTGQFHPDWGGQFLRILHLAACTSATVKMYADRKECDLQEVKINIELDFIAKENKTIINRKLEFIGNLDDAQKSRLLAIANACPVHKILSNPIEIHSSI